VGIALPAAGQQGSGIASKKARDRAQVPDERPLWEMHRNGRFRELLDTIQSLQARYPRWKPPEQLLALTRESYLSKRVDDAVRASDHGALIALGSESLEAFGCNRIDWAWALGEAYAHAKRQADAQALAERLVASCRDDHRLTTLYKAREWISPTAWGKLLEREAGSRRTPAVEEKFRKLQYDYRVTLFNSAQTEKNPQAFKLFEAIAAEVELYQDAGAALSGAWLYYSQTDIPQAKLWFARALQWKADAADARYGLALCASKEGLFDDALQNARALPSGYPDRERLMREALFGRARAAYDSRKYDEAVALLREADTYGALPRYGKTQYAWSLLQLGDAEGAASAFERLYREQPDTESAQGLRESYRRAGKDLSSLGLLAQSEPLASMVRTGDSQRMLDQKRFLSASRSDPEIAGSLGSAGVPQLSLAAALRDKTGNDGTSRLRLQLAPSVEGGMPFGGNAEVYVRVDRVSLDSGALPANALVGSGGPGAYAFAPITRVDGVQPQVLVRMERDGIWQLNLGMTPSGGPLSEHAFGRIERRAYTQWGQYDLAAFAEPVRESILSYVGLRDPYTGVAWGRISRYGVEARALRLIESDWAVSAGARSEQITGDSVADNDRFRADAAFGRNLGLSGFNYAVLGVEASFDRYRRNLSQFTLGNGGYYSPQKAVRGGVAFNFQTEERRPWIARGRASAGRTYRTQDEAPFFPNAPDGRTFAGSRDYGNDSSLELGAMWQLTGQLQAGLIFARSVAPQYNNTISGVVLRVLFEPRSAVTSADLPVRLFSDLR
jgi:tetratricopeptide (TPR) repeat protein